MTTDDLKWEAYKQSLKQSPHLLSSGGAKAAESAREEYESFLEHINREACYVCEKPLKTFSIKTPCIHWLLRPKGVKKNHILEVLEDKGYHRCAAFIRWFANYAGFAKNINDLSDEGKVDAHFHWTCRYRHVQWTFLCSQTDFGGHEGSQHAYPHYHFEMRLTGKPFIKFNDFHVKFTEEDSFWFRANADPDCPINQSFGPHGSGMEDALSIDPDTLIEHVVKDDSDDKSDAVFRLNSFIISEDGISDELLREAARRSEESGTTMAYHFKELGLNPNITVSPAHTIPEKAERPKRRKKY